MHLIFMLRNTNILDKSEHKNNDTPPTTTSVSSFFGDSFEENIGDKSIENELNLLRLDTFNGKLSEFWISRKKICRQAEVLHQFKISIQIHFEKSLF